MIRNALAEVRAAIDLATREAGRRIGEVELCAVSKTKPSSAIREAYEAGQRVFGENYVQELEQKRRELSDLADISFHLIGHVQSNKARQAAALATSVDTVDRLDIARELARRAATAGRILPVMIEVNVGGEAQKHGVAPSDLGALIEAVTLEPALTLTGLMTVPPHSDDPAAARPFFAKLRELRDAHGGPPRIRHLSMGMSHDFAVAIEEGSTMVRVGSAIFGAR